MSKENQTQPPWLLSCIMALAFLLPLFSAAQIVTNGGFNGPTGTTTPPSWANCGGSPDVQIISGTGIGIFGINTPPFEGSSYLGLVSGSGYTESAGQPATILSGNNYTGSVKLFRSTLHTSWTSTGQLRIYGGTNCSASTLLWTSGTITNLNNWQNYNINFVAPASYSYLVVSNYWNNTGSLDYFCMDALVLNNGPFAVNLVSFAAEEGDKGMDLNWELAGLTGEERLLLEWADVNGNFTTVADQRPGIANGTWAVSHAAPVMGLNYYRLRIIDQSGNEVLSAIREVMHQPEGKTSIFPNPASDVVNFAFELQQTGNVDLQLLDVAGRVVLQESRSYTAGSQIAKLSIPQGFAKGMYQLQARYDGQSVQHSVIIQ